jgi:hypothetical protein
MLFLVPVSLMVWKDLRYGGDDFPHYFPWRSCVKELHGLGCTLLRLQVLAQFAQSSKVCRICVAIFTEMHNQQ